VLAAIAYVPLLLTHHGMVGADTKQFLYLDPGGLMSRAATIWDPHTGLGTVTHQNIGYLWPMGPWYRVLTAVGVPVWVAQRLWTGTLLLAAGLGTRWLVRTLGWSGPGVAIASLAYMLSPYVVQYEARISAILMPWAGLPWLLGLAIWALRRGGWRHPALFAMVAATVGSVNATGLIYAGLAPLLWFPFAVWGLGSATVRRAAVAMAKIGALTLLLSLWWIAGIVTESRYGLNILRYTETIEVVARTGLPFEAVRGLGNWFFYGLDAIGPWVQPAKEYTEWGWLLGVSFAIPAMAFLGGVMIRWRDKVYFAGLILVGAALAVGVHPYAHPSPLGSVFKALATGTTLGLALRSTGRAVPLVALGTSVLLGAAIDALWRSRGAAGLTDQAYRRRAGMSRAATAVVGLLIVANMAPLWLGQFVDDHLQRPSALPGYWPAAAGWLDGRGLMTSGAHGYATRVLELPGADFSDYRWGTTLDPVTPGLMDRPFVGRELQPSGSPASADLIRALDGQLQQGILDPAAIAPVARLMGVGDVLLRSDLQYERFRTPRPKATWQLFDPVPPAGLGPATAFGPAVTEHPLIPFTDATTLATQTATAPPAVAVFGVQDPLPIVRTEPVAGTVLMAGDGEGVVDAAAAGLLDGRQPVLYAASLDTDPAAMAATLAQGVDLVLTDTNRRRAQRWGTVRDVNGYTEQAGETPIVADTNDARLPLFPGATGDAYTVSQQRGGASVQATRYGNDVSYSPADRSDQAMDGNLGTAWRVGSSAEAIGQSLRVNLAQPMTTDEITLVQPLTPVRTPPPGTAAGPRFQPPQPQTRVITRVTLSFDGGHPQTRTLDTSSLRSAGQRLTFPALTFHRLDIRIDDTSTHRRDHRQDNAVGFAEVRIGPPASAPSITEVVRLPTDLLAAAGGQSDQHRLFVLLTRARSNPAETFRPDEEPALARTFTLPTTRTFSVRGTARVSALAPDQQVDRLLGRPDPPLINSSGRLPGDLAARSASALDGDPATWWSPAFGAQQGGWLSVNLPHPVDLNLWTMRIVVDDLHSVPTRLRIKIDDQPARLVTLPALPVSTSPGAIVTVPIDLGEPVTAKSRVTVTIDAIRPVTTLDAVNGRIGTLPVAIAELGIPGITVPAASATVPDGCRTDLLSIDGRPVGVRITATTAAAGRLDGLPFEQCGPDVTLGAGSHEIRTALGRLTGLAIDQLVLASEKGGAALAPSGAGTPAAAAPTPAVIVVRESATSLRLRIQPSASAAPYWLVFGQSFNSGWKAKVTGSQSAGLGGRRLIDGYANGWLVNPEAGQPVEISLTWAPQRQVDAALGLSALGLLLCIALAAARPRLPGYEAPAGARSLRLPERPAGYRPWQPDGQPLLGRTIVGLAVGSGVVAALLIGWPAGLLMAGLVALACRPGHYQVVLGAVAVAAMVETGGLITEGQMSHHYRLILEWPQHFEWVSGLAWVAVASLAAEATVRHVRGWRPRPGDHRGRPDS
jgi:arabinofuranan 3-O-arabinosyltransferase